MNPTLAMLGPIEVMQFRDLLDESNLPSQLPKGLGGSPVNLLTRELLSRGHHILLLTLDPEVKDEVVLQGPNLKICIGPFRPNRARDFFSVECEYLRKVLKREQPDVIHAQWTYEYALAAQASDLPHVITAHDAPFNVLRLGFRPYRIVRTLMAWRVLRRARRVVSVSPHVARHVSRFMGYRGPAEVIPNGMPESLFVRQHINRQVDRPLTFATILVGWGGLKNGQVAVDAFVQLRRVVPEVKLLMFGSGHGKNEEGERWARERGMSEGIEFAGQVPYAVLMDRLANEVDVLVHPALEEAQPMVLIEAMALALPIIGGEASGGVPWTLDDGKAGLLVDVTDAKAVFAAMRRLAESAEERAEWGARGRQLAEQRFHIRVVANAYERIYAALLRHGQ